jgi:hypothetical protein
MVSRLFVLRSNPVFHVKKGISIEMFLWKEDIEEICAEEKELEDGKNGEDCSASMRMIANNRSKMRYYLLSSYC